MADSVKPSGAHEEVLNSAIETCLAPLASNEETRSHLETLGWAEVNDDKATTFKSLYYANVAGNFRSDDLEYTVGNAAFMAGSILGNSSLGSDQPSFVRENVVLSVIGVEEGTPYCVLTSENGRVEPALYRHGMRPLAANTSDFATQVIGGGALAVYTANSLNKEHFLQAWSGDAKFVESEGLQDLLDNFPAVVLAIHPLDTLKTQGDR